MSVYSILPSLGCMALILAIAATPVFAQADTPPSPKAHRVRSIDGLRGFLAFAVFFHHAAIYHTFLVSGSWELTPSRFYNFLGPAGVDVFFMITGYFFWTKMIKEKGKPGWVALYIGRIFRIGPLYLAAVGFTLMIVLVHEGLHLHERAVMVVLRVAKWLLSLGLFYPSAQINGYQRPDLLMAAVTWSLHWEWLFYFSLPLTALLARSRRTHLPAVLVALAVGLFLTARHAPVRSTVELATLFLIGMACASLKSLNLTLPISDRLASILILLLLPAMFLFSEPYKAGPIVLLGFSFYLVVSGCTVFGLLVCRPARRLGDVSYGIYLLQGLVLAMLFRWSFLRSVALRSPLYHWILTLIAAIVLILVATAAHVLIERPGIAFGRRVNLRLHPSPGQLPIRE